MGIRSVFSRMKAPKKAGKTSISTKSSGSGVKTEFLIQFVGFEGEPTYELTSSLSIGSESADVILDEESISPRHCTFILNQDVVLLMDHASKSGTMIGKMQLSPGKSYIVTEKDKIKIGDIGVNLLKVEMPLELTEETQEEETLEEEVVNLEQTGEFEAPALKTEDKTQDIDLSLLKEESIVEEDLSESPKARKKREKKEKALQKKKEKELQKKNKKDKVRYSSGTAANALIRVLALSIDFAIFYLVLALYGQEELMNLLGEFIPFEMISDLALNEIKTYIPNLNELLLSFSIEDAKAFITLSISLYSIFFLYRLLSALIFKVTLGQFLLGLNVSGNALLKRFLGFLRELFFLILSPLFLLTHIGTLFSKRSLEELITGTRIEVTSSLKTTILTVLFIPLMAMLVLVSPLFKNFDLPSYIVYTDSLNKPQTVEESSPSYSKTMRLGSIRSEESLASGTITELDGKKFFYPELIFTSEESTVSIQLKKTFSFASLLKILFNNMYLDTESFPALREFAGTSEGGGFQSKFTDAKIMQMGGELNQVFKDFLNPSFEKIPDVLFQYGPLFQSIVDFREGLSGVSGAKLTEINLSYFGKTPVVILKTSGVKNQFLFFPLGVRPTPLYQANLKSDALFDQVFAKLRSNIFNTLTFKEIAKAEGSVYAPEMVDELAHLVSSKNVKQEKIFKYYFSMAQKEVSQNKSSESLNSSLEKTLRLIDKANTDGNYAYLYQSLSEVKNALENKDKKYFDGFKSYGKTKK